MTSPSNNSALLDSNNTVKGSAVGTHGGLRHCRLPSRHLQWVGELPGWPTPHYMKDTRGQKKKILGVAPPLPTEDVGLHCKDQSAFPSLWNIHLLRKTAHLHLPVHCWTLAPSQSCWWTRRLETAFLWPPDSVKPFEIKAGPLASFFCNFMEYIKYTC